MPAQAESAWSDWSRDAVRLMQERNEAWVRDYGLQGCHYQWSLDSAQMVFRSGASEVVADICVVGSVSEAEGTFLWAWANESIPPHSRRGLERVREFGERNALELLTSPEWPAAGAEGLEMAAIAGKILDASGLWIDTFKGVTWFFALSSLRRTSPGQLTHAD